MKIFCLFLLFFTVQILAMDKDKFNNIIEKINDSKLDEVKAELDKILPEYKDDAEYYVLQFNYYYAKARKNYIVLKTSQPDKSDSLYFEIKDMKDSSTVGFMTDSADYDYSVLSEGITKFKLALDKFPDRLDMLFGLVYMSSECRLFNEIKYALIKTMERSIKNDNKWLWSFNEPLDDAKAFMNDNMQSYLIKLIDYNNSTADSVFLTVSERIVQLFPENVVGYNNIGIYYYINKDYDTALKYYLKAEAIAPEDIIVLSNLASIATKKNEKANAESYYRKIVKYGNDDDKLWAEEQIKNLQK